MDTKAEIMRAYSKFEQENYQEAINASILLIPELNRELQGLMYFLVTNCHMQMGNHEEAYTACKQAAERGNSDAEAHLPMIEQLLAM